MNIPNTRQANLPKYYTIAQEIMDKIEEGRLRPGDKTPSENEIIANYHVSNTTARKILQKMENHGCVQRIKGKGTFVLPRKWVERSAGKILSFTANMLQTGRRPATKLLDCRRLSSAYSAVINGNKFVMKPPILKIHRLRFADGVPMLLETRYISLAVCPNINEKKLEGSLYDIYLKDNHLRLTAVDQMLSAVMLDDSVRSFFDLDKPVPAFRVEGATLCGTSILLEMEDSLYRGDLYRFAVRAT